MAWRLRTLLLVNLCVSSPAMYAQGSSAPVMVSSSNALPEAPTVQESHTPEKVSPAPSSPHQTKRILGVVPNFRSVSADSKLPPDTPKDKMLTGLEDSFDYSSFVFVGMEAGVYYGLDSTPEFHRGFVSFGRYYWHAFVDNADEDIWVESIFPVALRQDSRYYTLGRGSKLKRVGYALSRTLVTRSDGGREVFNSSEVLGAGVASGISSLYYPTANRTVGSIGNLWLTNVLIDGGTFVFKEFWPDLNDSVFHQKE